MGKEGFTIFFQYIGKGKETGARETKNRKKREEKWALVLEAFNDGRAARKVPMPPYELQQVS